MDFAKDFMESSSKHYSKGVSLSKREEYIEALKEFNKSISCLYTGWHFVEKNQSRGAAYYQGLLEEQLNFICITGEYVAQIVNSALLSKSMRIFKTFLPHLTEIVEKLKEHEDSLISSQKNQLDRFSELLAEVKVFALAVEGEGFEMTELELMDIDFELESNYKKLCSLDICPLGYTSAVGASSDSSSSDSSCFIATAAYSTSIHPDLDTFREFRDKRLLSNFIGKLLVSIYYKLGPILASFIERLPIIKLFIRKQLVSLAEWMRAKKITNQ